MPDVDQMNSYSSLGVIEDMLDVPAQLDWVCTPLHILFFIHNLTLNRTYMIAASQASRGLSSTPSGIPMTQRLQYTISPPFNPEQHQVVIELASPDDSEV